MTKIFKYILFGLGNVGRAVVVQLRGAEELHLQRFGLVFRPFAIRDSTTTVIGDAQNGLSAAMCDQLLALKKNNQKLADFKAAPTSDISPDDLIEKYAKPGVVVVDTSASDTLGNALARAIELGAVVVMANKRPVTGSQAVFDRLTAPENISRLGLASTVGAGTPFIAALMRLVGSGDHVRLVRGTMSGTLGFLSTGLENCQRYSDIVKEAYDKGYTEPDPRDDLGGVDVARKALIIARLLGQKLEMKDVSIEPLYSDELAKLSVPDFLKEMSSMNNTYAHRAQEAAAQGLVLRYVAQVEQGSCKVGLAGVSKDSPLGRLKGTQNMVEFHTDVYGHLPLVIQGAGAGATVTAAGVVGDMANICSAQRL